jgi:hypothetical protein
MCMRVYMFDEGLGTNPLRNTVGEPWAYSAKIYEDPVVGAPYFVAVVVEWFDRYQSSGLDITYPIFQVCPSVVAFPGHGRLTLAARFVRALATCSKGTRSINLGCGPSD